MKKNSRARAARKPAAVTSGAKTLGQWLNATNLICRHRDAAKGRCTQSDRPAVLRAVELIRATPQSRRAEFATQQGSGRAKYRNPEEIVTAAEELYEAFTGRPADSVTEIEQPVYFPRDLADLGELRELQIIIADGKKLATVGFEGKSVRVAAAGIRTDTRGIYGTELYFVAGDQRLNLAKLDAADQADKPTVYVGQLYKITYYTSKHFHKFKPSEYEHELGEVSGIRPVLGYDPHSKLMFLSGGRYQIRPEGIVD